MLTAVSIWAQPRGNYQRPQNDSLRAEKVANYYNDQLLLTADQKAQLQSVYGDFFADMKTARDANHRQMLEKAKALETQRDQKLASVLSKEQYAQYQQLVTVRKAMRDERRGQRMHKPGSCANCPMGPGAPQGQQAPPAPGQD